MFFLFEYLCIVYNKFKSEIESLSISKNTIIYLAISGGVDSMVLSHLLIQSKIPHTLLHCNFKLRDSESNQDEQFVIEYAKNNNLEYHITSFDTEQIAEELKLTTQECARKLRYDWFFTFLEKKDSILLTAHHLDDSIETFFINLLRGTGLKGLTGIPSGAQNIYRPLLSCSKEEILNFTKNNDINFREDSSNQSDNYLRNKLRHHFIPDLKSLTSNFDSKISTLFTELKETHLFIEQYLAEYKTKLNTSKQISLSELNAIPQFMWHKLFSKYGISRVHNDELIKLSNSQTGSIFNSSSHTLLKDRNNLLIEDKKTAEPISIIINDFSAEVELTNGKLTFEIINDSDKIKFKTSSAYLDLSRIKWPITIRNWTIGDKIIPLGQNGNKLISKVLVDKKINHFQKKNQFVLESNGEIIWLLDLMVSNKFAITNKTTKIIKIEHIQY